MDRSLPLTWLGPVFDPSGYADEGRGFLCALEREGVRVALRPLRRHVPGFREGLPEAERRILARQIDRPIAERPILVQHHTADGFARTTDATLHIGRTMFETDSIPPFWVHCCNRMDELWLPSQFNLQTFRRAGVTAPVVIVPGGIDTDSYRPEGPALSVQGLRGTVFLSVFEWRLGKGWDVLLRAWAEAFAPTDDVTLVLRTYPLGRVAGQDNAAVINARIDAFLRDACGLDRRDVAPIHVLGESIPAEQMPALYRIASALVAPTRGEGWGRPFMEAMASAVPVIATNWSAHLEFMHAENSLLIDIDGLEPADGSEVANYGAQQWAAPSVAHLVTRLREVHADPGATAALGRRAREEMRAEWPWKRAARVIADRLAELHARRPDAAPAPRAALVGATPTLRLDGPFFDPHPTDGDADRFAGALATHWPSTPRIRTRGVTTERPAVGAPALAAWHALSASGEEQHTPPHPDIADVVVTWLDPHAPPPVRPSTRWWIVHTGNAVGTMVPGHLVRTLRDLADEVWVPNQLAEHACRTIGLPSSALWCCPLPAPLPDAPPTGPRFPTAADRAPTVATETDLARRRGPRERVFVLPVRSADDLGPADALLRAWPHTVPATAHVRLLIHAAHGDDAQIIDWVERVQRDIAYGRRQRGAPVEVATDLLRDEELAALARTADVLLLPFAAPETQRLAELVTVYGRPVVRGVPDVADVEARPYAIAHAKGAPFPLAAWRAAIRALATPPVEQPRTAAWTRDLNDGRCTTLTSPPSAALDAWGSAATRRLLDEPWQDACRAARQHASDGPVVQPFLLHEARTTTVLAMPDWHDGSGGGIVRSFAHACNADDDCSLVLCLDPAQGVSVDDVASIVHEALAAAGHDATSGPDIVLVPDALDDAVRAALIRRCDALVALADPRAAQIARALGTPTLSRLATASWRALFTHVPAA